MVPLPDALQLLAVEVVAALVRCCHGRGLCAARVGLEPCARCSSEVPRQSEHRPSLDPCDWCERRRASYAVEVLHEQCPPLSALVLYDAALVNVAACRGVDVRFGQSELRAVVAYAILLSSWHLRESCCVVAVVLVGCDDTCLVGTPDVVGNGAERASVGHVVCRDEHVFAVNLIHVVSFANGRTVGYDDSVCALYGSAHVGLQLSAVHLAVAMYSIYLAVVVEEHAEVVDASLHVVVLPRSAYVFGGVALQPLAVDVREDVELSVGVAYAWCPDALPVDLLVVAQREGVVVEVEAVEAVADVLPVDEVA